MTITQSEAMSRLQDIIRDTVKLLSRLLWAMRSGEVVCAGDHGRLAGRCATCKAQA